MASWQDALYTLFQDEAEALRVRAFKDRRSESSIVREALRRFLKIED